MLGCYIRGSDSLHIYSRITASAMPGSSGTITADMLLPEFYEDIYSDLIKQMNFKDDFVRCLEPIAAFPWSEAALGCPIKLNNRGFWAEQVSPKDLRNVIINAPNPENNIWIKKYGGIIDYFHQCFNGELPVGQTIIRGPLDMLSAAMGEENLIYAFYDDPDFVHAALGYCIKIIAAFNRQHKTRLYYHGGTVCGRFYIWTEGFCMRYQNDALVLISPQLYGDFILPYDREITLQSNHCVYHLHAPALHLIDKIVNIQSVDIIQINKDVANVSIESMIKPLQRIQEAGKSILLKGEFNENDIEIIRKNIDRRGLAVGCVVPDSRCGMDIMEYMRSIKW